MSKRLNKQSAAPNAMLTRLSHTKLAVLLLPMIVITASGCNSFIYPTGIPVGRVPRQLLAVERKDDFEDISLLRLRQDPPAFYALGPGDILGIYVKGVIGNEDDLPPIHFPEDASQPPAIGTPVVVREDGSISLPIIEPIDVEGLSLIEATQLIQTAYTGGPDPILQEDTQVSVTMIRRRMVQVLVIREESGGVADVTKRGTGHVVDLAAYENDVLHALNETGGLPGLDAENEILVLRGLFADGADYDSIVQQATAHDGFCQDPCFCDERPVPDAPHVTRIPLRYNPNSPPTFSHEDILLGHGDIVIIRSRDRESFFTAGLLGGGEHLLPRDKDLDVIGAIALAGGQLGNTGTGISGIAGGAGGGVGGFGGGGIGNRTVLQPSEVLIIRELPCGDSITIKVNLNEALQNPGARVLIKPKDVVLLRFSLLEEVVNTAFSIININFLFSGFNGNGF